MDNYLSKGQVMYWIDQIGRMLDDNDKESGEKIVRNYLAEISELARYE